MKGRSMTPHERARAIVDLLTYDPGTASLTRAHRRRGSQNPDRDAGLAITCPQCGSEFVTSRVNQRFCSYICKRRYHGRRRRGEPLLDGEQGLAPR